MRPECAVAALGLTTALLVLPQCLHSDTADGATPPAPAAKRTDANRNRVPDLFEQEPYTSFLVLRGARPANLLAWAYPLPVRRGQPLTVAVKHAATAAVLRMRVEPGDAVPRIAERPPADSGLTQVRFEIPADAEGDSVRITVWLEGVTLFRAVALASGPEFGEFVHVEQLPEVIHKVPAVYPAGAQRAGVSGTVMVQALVGEDGRVRETRIVKSVAGLDAAAESAVRQWRFRPARAKGEPVAVWVAVPVQFTLRD